MQETKIRIRIHKNIGNKTFGQQKLCEKIEKLNFNYQKNETFNCTQKLKLRIRIQKKSKYKIG